MELLLGFQLSGGEFQVTQIEFFASRNRECEGAFVEGLWASVLFQFREISGTFVPHANPPLTGGNICQFEASVLVRDCGIRVIQHNQPCAHPRVDRAVDAGRQSFSLSNDALRGLTDGNHLIEWCGTFEPCGGVVSHGV